MINPVDCKLEPYPQGGLLQGFGVNGPLYAPLKGHPGIDLYAPKGTPVKACFDGYVDYVQPNDGTNGRGITLRGIPNGDTQLEVEYAHMGSVCVVAGQAVKQGDMIATMGNSGFSVVGPVAFWNNQNPDNGVHLHFGVRVLKKDAQGIFRPEHDINDGLRGCTDPLPYLGGLVAPPVKPQGYTYKTFREKYGYSPNTNPAMDNLPFEITDKNFDIVRNAIPPNLWPKYDQEFRQPS